MMLQSTNLRKITTLIFRFFFDENEQLREKLNITAFPANFVINNGVIEKSWVGSPRNVEELKEKLEITSDK